MIIEARDDILTLSGSMDKNLWPSIESAAGLLLRLHPRGILIDASGLRKVTPEGAKTFLDAIAYIERYRARIVLCQVPEGVLEVIRTLPGLRSQVAIAETCDQARASLELAAADRERAGRTGRRPASVDGAGAQRSVLVPLLRGSGSVREAVALAFNLGTVSAGGEKGDGRGRARVLPQIVVSYILLVPRTMPLNAPSPEEEEAARTMLNEAEETLAALGLPAQTDVARTRDAEEEILVQIGRRNVDLIAMALPRGPEPTEESLAELVVNLIDRAPCEVVLLR